MKTADPELMRAINRFHVMDAIRRSGPISRVEIAQKTDLSPPTVSAITAALIDDRMILPRAIGGVRDTTRGRPRVMLELNPDAAYVVGVKLARDQITVAATNFRADVLKTLSMPIRIDRQPLSVIADLVEDGVRRCIADAGLAIGAINGVCIGLPGIVERGSSKIRQSEIFRERDVDLGAEVSARIGIAVTVDSDVNLVTLSEHWFGHGRDLNDFVVVSIEHNLGLGIMHNGELFRGANGVNPDLGDFLVRQSSGQNTPTRLETIILNAMNSSNEDGSEPSVDMIDADDETVEAVGDALGFAIASIITLFAPPKVILAGAALAAGERLLQPLRAAVKRYTPVGLVGVSEMVVHEWGDDNWARGAAAMTLRELYGAPWGTTGPARAQ
jgi:predicted NBD/HSP70 family sugar kinase